MRSADFVIDTSCMALIDLEEVRVHCQLPVLSKLPAKCSYFPDELREALFCMLQINSKLCPVC